jgi:hypothetical protein
MCASSSSWETRPISETRARLFGGRERSTNAARTNGYCEGKLRSACQKALRAHRSRDRDQDPPLARARWQARN